MLASLTLTNFRGFAKLEMPRLARVNLIGGVNNAGKTAILEAIFLLLGRGERLNLLPKLFRAGTGVNDKRYFWDWIRKKNASDEDTSIAASIEEIGSGRVVFRITQPQQLQGMQHVANLHSWMLWSQPIPAPLVPKWPRPEVFSTAPTPPVEDAQIYIKAVKKIDNEERIEDLLREVDPRLKRVRVFPDENSNQPLLHVGLIGSEAFPATQLGQGFNRLMRIYSALLSEESTVFLIDEIETGLHHNVLPTIWKGLAAVARKENVQIFATTHSREAILTAHRIFSEEPEYDFAYHRLERDSHGNVQVITYDKDRLEGADERNFELR